MKTVVLSVSAVLTLVIYGLFAQDTNWDSLPDDYLPFVLQRVDTSFVGASEFLSGFSVSIDLPRDLVSEDISEDDLLSIIDSQDITGIFEYPNGRSTLIAYDVVDYRGRDEIYMKTGQGYFIWEDYRFRKDTLMFVIDWWYSPPASELDLRALEMAEDLLADSSNWRRDDDRKCLDDADTKRWSLFCALKHASIMVMGEYNHHNTAMQAVRSIIDENYPEHDFAHTLMDFNNAPSTSYADVLSILSQARHRIRREISQSSD